MDEMMNVDVVEDVAEEAIKAMPEWKFDVKSGIIGAVVTGVVFVGGFVAKKLVVDKKVFRLGKKDLDDEDFDDNFEEVIDEKSSDK